MLKLPKDATLTSIKSVALNMYGDKEICVVLSPTDFINFFEYILDLFLFSQYSKIPTN